MDKVFSVTRTHEDWAKINGAIEHWYSIALNEGQHEIEGDDEALLFTAEVERLLPRPASRTFSIATEALSAELELLKRDHYDEGVNNNCDGCARAHAIRIELDKLKEIAND